MFQIAHIINDYFVVSFKVWCKVNLDRLQLLNQSRHLYITGQGLWSSTPFMVPHVNYYLKSHRAIKFYYGSRLYQQKSIYCLDTI